ncbi:hypothetical protein AWU65_20325 [Paenibacillus glucanolyticus]|uniref:Uncharacterized protein n=1 Tax=Paenibacillus glucanolyticus TaxID=59843 RepID=A0A163LG75_9BACL|nr:hypothetical protein [Paenibacillus glucanolyticus]KZS48105.1 hypothetical protein AWU65_20325 [Paenibacillus glucanolyticus]
MINRVKLIDQTKLMGCLKKELEFCIKEKFNEKNTRFYLGRETVLTDIINQIESDKFCPDTWKCLVCGSDVTNYEPEYCCTYISMDTPCGCMGLPIEPPLCSAECSEKIFGKAAGSNGMSRDVDYLLKFSQKDFEKFVDAGEYSDQNVIDLWREVKAAQEEIARINCNYYADRQRFRDHVKKLAEVETPTQVLKKLLETKIPWKKYDPENPPELNVTCLVSTGIRPVTAFLDVDETGAMLWLNSDSAEMISGVSHYAVIHIPESVT